MRLAEIEHSELYSFCFLIVNFIKPEFGKSECRWALGGICILHTKVELDGSKVLYFNNSITS